MHFVDPQAGRHFADPQKIHVCFVILQKAQVHFVGPRNVHGTMLTIGMWARTLSTPGMAFGMPVRRLQIIKKGVCIDALTLRYCTSNTKCRRT